MTPTPDFTEVFEAVSRGYSSITTMRMVDSLSVILAIGCVLIAVSFVGVVLTIKYRKQIKKWFDL